MPDEAKIAAARALIERQMHASEAERQKFLDAIETQIKAADPEGIRPLLLYIKEVQFAGRAATMALVKLVKEKLDSSPTLDDNDKAILDAWSRAPEATIDNVLKKFATGLKPSDQEIVNAWLAEMTERERSFVTTGAVVGRDIDAGLFVAVNLYRGMLVGVTREKLLSALRICQIYCGLPAYVAASRTLVALEEILAEMPRDATPAEVIDRMVERFDLSF